MDLATRIEQFEAVVNDDPSDQMAWFALGNALTEAERHREAATAYERVIALNSQMSRAYELAARQYIAMGDNDNALPLLRQGWDIADQNGDLKVKSAVEDLFVELGEEPPKLPDIDPADLPDDAIICAKTKRPGSRMTRPPFKGPIGEWIAEHITQETFHEWIGQGTKVINELRLDLSRDEDEKTYDRYMWEYLNVPSELTGHVPDGTTQTF
jgi:Fe-S cluster biosynthesis and repair protein YggX